jgi:hypothetical protein
MYVYANHHDEWPPPNEEQGTRDRATQAHTGQRGPTRTHSSQCRQTKGHRRPTTANEGQRGHREGDENENTIGVVQALGTYFLYLHIFIILINGFYYI